VQFCFAIHVPENVRRRSNETAAPLYLTTSSAALLEKTAHRWCFLTYSLNLQCWGFNEAPAK
jgi:hypothetical protein